MPCVVLRKLLLRASWVLISSTAVWLRSLAMVMKPSAEESLRAFWSSIAESLNWVKREFVRRTAGIS